MDKVSRISGGQLTILLLASRLSNCLLLTPDSIDGLYITDRLFAVALNAVFVLLLFLPTLLVLRRYPRHGLIDRGYVYARWCGRGLCGGYMVLCLFILCLDIVQFYDFAEKVMKSGFSVPWLTVALIAVAFIASSYGIQALGRAAMPVALFSVACLLVFSGALLSEMRWLHFPPLANARLGDVIGSAVKELPRTAEVVAIGMLYPYISGSRWRACASFCGWTALFTALVSATALGVLGDFALHTVYPYYTAATAAQIGVFQRMDILITAVWLSTFFIRLTLFCTLFTDAARRLFGRKARLWSAVGGGFLLAGFTLWISRSSTAHGWEIVTAVYWWVLGVFCVVLPLLLALLKRRRRV